VDIEQQERLTGDSGYTFRKLLSLWVNGATAFSVKPLRIATFLGLIIAIIGFVGIIFVLANKVVHPEVPLGYSSTLTVMLFLGGVIMLILGMMGEYIGRIFISINHSPQYVIRNRTK
jgi:undecaprenyl-phosphate 4-deoxy-4-formamido-L-arabinose transferase